jgi:hypothetical protein
VSLTLITQLAFPWRNPTQTNTVDRPYIMYSTLLAADHRGIDCRLEHFTAATEFEIILQPKYVDNHGHRRDRAKAILYVMHVAKRNMHPTKSADPGHPRSETCWLAVSYQKLTTVRPLISESENHNPHNYPNSTHKLHATFF